MTARKTGPKSKSGKRTKQKKEDGKITEPGKTQAKRKLFIDHPGAGEAIWSGHYAARISAPASEVVEARVDEGPWTLCRNEAGHWWLDIEGLSDGGHTLSARLIKSGKNDTVVRKFSVSRE